MDVQKATLPVHEELKKLMDERGWSPLELAAASGINPGTISRYLNAQRGFRVDRRSIHTYRSFEQAFGLPEGYFLEEQLDQALKSVTGLVKEGFIHLVDLEALVAAAEFEKTHTGEAAP